eukprot:TRINITY_DN31337_c0_g3_i1.p1 TRINITY_DN31337_c0_g3~~TRINITY_DN31337_c0_g3_i1.p1  ORF type:complete len:102 (+),score=12.10 TRINITY_DN31337_c0_g3_i1:203-508(+)
MEMPSIYKESLILNRGTTYKLQSEDSEVFALNALPGPVARVATCALLSMQASPRLVIELARCTAVQWMANRPHRGHLGWKIPSIKAWRIIHRQDWKMALHR